MKESVSVDVYTPIRNTVIVHWPGRAFPAISIQGDTFATLATLAREAHQAASGDDREGLMEALADLCASMTALQGYYEDVVRENGLSIPYSR